MNNHTADIFTKPATDETFLSLEAIAKVVIGHFVIRECEHMSICTLNVTKWFRQFVERSFKLNSLFYQIIN
jgi:hypothetical protein